MAKAKGRSKRSAVLAGQYAGYSGNELTKGKYVKFDHTYWQWSNPTSGYSTCGSTT